MKLVSIEALLVASDQSCSDCGCGSCLNCCSHTGGGQIT